MLIKEVENSLRNSQSTNRCSKHSSQVLVPHVRCDTCQVKLRFEMLKDVLVSPLQVRLLHLHLSPWQLPPDGVAHIWREEKKASLWIHVTGSIFIVKLFGNLLQPRLLKGNNEVIMFYYTCFQDVGFCFNDGLYTGKGGFSRSVFQMAAVTAKCT